MSDTTLRVIGTAIAIGGLAIGYFLIVSARMRFVGGDAGSVARLGILARGILSFARSTGQWRKEKRFSDLFRQVAGINPTILCFALALSSVAAGLFCQNYLSIEVRSGARQRAFWNPLGLMWGFVGVAVSPSSLAALATSYFVRRGYSRATLLEPKSESSDIHTALMVPAMWTGIAVAAMALAAQGLLKVAWPSLRWYVRAGTVLEQFEALGFRIAAFAMILVAATHRTTKMKLFNRLVKIYFTWWAARLAFDLSFGFTIGALRLAGGSGLRHILQDLLPSLVWFAVYATAFSIAWLRSRELAEKHPPAADTPAPSSEAK